MKYPSWLPDKYAAAMWRSYHSANPGLKLTAPVIEYRKKDGKWGGPECGLGYGGQLRASEPVVFSASANPASSGARLTAGRRHLVKFPGSSVR